MPRIFVSYRRDDSRTFTGRIYDRLVVVFGEANVFRDLDGIALGSDFRRVIEREVASCDIFLAVIGPRWTTITDSQNLQRLDDPADFVRIEVETALRLPDVHVIPVLVDGARLPPAADLPTTLADLPYRNAAIVRDDPDFHKDVDKLIASIEKLSPVSESSTSKIGHESAPSEPPARIDVPKPAFGCRGVSITVTVAVLSLLFAFLALFPEQTRTAWLYSLGLLPTTPTQSIAIVLSVTPLLSTPTPTDTLSPTLYVPPNITATALIQLNTTATEIMLQRTVDAKQTANVLSFAESTHIAETAVAVPTSSRTASPVQIINSFPAPGDLPNGIACSANGLLLADNTAKLFEIDLSGKLVTVYQSSDATPTGLGTDGAHFWVQTSSRNLIHEFQISGSQLVAGQSFPSPIQTVGGGITNDMAWDGNGWWIADQKFLLGPTRLRR